MSALAAALKRPYRRPVGCTVCTLLHVDVREGESSCRRCGTPLRSRAPQSLARSWAYLVAAAILYVPANAYPVLETRTPTDSGPHTIAEGIAELFAGGSWLLALLVFFASILVPMLKMLAMALLILSVRMRSSWRLRERAELYRLLEFVGRWSMLDIYVVAMLVALVQLGALATVTAGPGALAFAAVVVLTMLSTQAFDPRLMWDAAGLNESPERAGV